ncbi:hypothetical protein HN51_012933 [Arachis hypogaea]|uniref:Root meristem growth factor n=2 Tax=Arachis TaxID=3817 RepID=A0A445DSH6_ARAHY|nr:uncharacterized protein LOC107480338 [Arachis duranensis]QHO58525.1 uncharacterized protein DS421_3g91380 [Arachis hypogaea]RYR66087.1 hypothetical protein Ahy_A03g012039 [Arachis hypogaea]
MAGVQKNCTLIVVLILLCFITIQARARTLKERSNMGGTTKDANIDHDHHGDDKFKPKEDEGNGSSGEVFAMDYTPASRKPPIHN